MLNADDLAAMWVCLRENCVIDDATGAEKVRASFIGFFSGAETMLTMMLILRCLFHVDEL